MKAIILAAGQGTRLKKYTKDLPKGMLKFMGRTIIERQMRIFKECGIEKIIIIKGFAGDKIKYKNVKYYTNHEYDSTNMVASLLTAKEEFNEDIIVSYSDILFNKELLEGVIKSPGDYVVAVDDNWKKYWEARYGRIEFDTESLSLDENNNITSLGKENPLFDEIDARYIGLLKFSKIGLKNILEIVEKDYHEYLFKPWKNSGESIRKAYMTDLIQAVIESGSKVKAKKFTNGWIEFDTNEDYELACEWAKTGLINKFVEID